jgi:predicted nucleic acid-binding Zn ribbon protein
VIHGVHADGPATCPVCHVGPVRKAVSAPTIHFKGTGWAKKDRSAASRSAARASSAASAAGAGSGAGSDSATAADPAAGSSQDTTAAPAPDKAKSGGEPSKATGSRPGGSGAAD